MLKSPTGNSGIFYFPIFPNKSYFYLMQGLVLKSTGSWYDVKLESGERVSARIRGKFRLEGFKVTNPVAAGDNVELEKDKDDNYVIHQIYPYESAV